MIEDVKRFFLQLTDQFIMINVTLTIHYLSLWDCTYRYDDVTYTKLLEGLLGF